MIRREMVDELLRGCAGRMPSDAFDALVERATEDERLAAAARMAAAAIQQAAEPPSLLSLDLRQLQHAASQHLLLANAMLWLADRLGPEWSSRPDVTLGTVLKPLPRNRLAHLTRELSRVGLRLNDGADDHTT